MDLVRQTYYIYLRNLKIWVRLPAAFFPPLIITAFLYLVFVGSFKEVIRLPGFPADDYASFLTAMILVQAVVFSGGDAGFSMLTDIMSGYFDKLLLAPINRFSILLGSLLLAGTRAILQAALIVLLALALGVTFKTGPLGIVTVIFITGFFGIIWACLGLIIALQTKSAQATQASFVLFFPFIFVTTAFMPMEYLSGWFRLGVVVNPVNYVLEGIRALVIVGWEWDTIVVGLWALAGMATVLIASATWLYRRATV